MSPLFNWVAKVPEIISTIRQAGKIARQEEFPNQLSDLEDHFSKKFEVLFCGRVTVAHKNAPPALIDECIEKFNDVSYTKNLDAPRQSDTADPFSGFPISDKFRSIFQPSAGEEQAAQPMRKSYSQPGLRSFAFKKDSQSWSLKSHSLARSLDGDEVLTLSLKSQFIQGQNVQPTDIAGNRIMLFTVKSHDFVCLAFLIVEILAVSGNEGIWVLV
ncbi:TBC1 domain family member 1-like isoform 2-T2 [Vipera latastei]